MSIRLECECGQVMQVRDDMAGKRGKCPRCGHILVVPGAGAAEDRTPTPDSKAQGGAGVTCGSSAAVPWKLLTGVVVVCSVALAIFCVKVVRAPVPQSAGPELRPPGAQTPAAAREEIEGAVPVAVQGRAASLAPEPAAPAWQPEGSVRVTNLVLTDLVLDGNGDLLPTYVQIRDAAREILASAGALNLAEADDQADLAERIANGLNVSPGQSIEVLGQDSTGVRYSVGAVRVTAEGRVEFVLNPQIRSGRW